MVSLGSSNLNALNSSSFNMDDLLNKDSITVESTQPKVKISFESHTFHCMRFEDPADKGFTDNLNNFLLEIIKNENIKDENVKLIASKLMDVCVHHEVKYWDNKEIEEIQRKNKEKEDAKKAGEF